MAGARSADGAGREKAPRPVSSTELAELFDCGVKEIEAHAREGIVVRIGRGRYDERQSVRNYVCHLRKVAAGYTSADGTVDAVAANVAKRQVETRLLDLKYDREVGKVIEINAARHLWSGLVRTLRQFVRGLPTKIVFIVPHLSNDDMRAIRKLVDDGLADAALDRGYDLGPAPEEQIEDLEGETIATDQVDDEIDPPAEPEDPIVRPDERELGADEPAEPRTRPSPLEPEADELADQ